MGGQNTSPTAFIVEAFETNYVVKVHNQKVEHLCKTEKCCRCCAKDTCGVHTILPIQVRKKCSLKTE